MKKFDIGDVVILKSGGPKMTVEKYVERQDCETTGTVGCSGSSGCCSPSVGNFGPYTAPKVPICCCVYFIEGTATPLHVELDDKLLEPAVTG